MHTTTLTAEEHETLSLGLAQVRSEPAFRTLQNRLPGELVVGGARTGQQLREQFLPPTTDALQRSPPKLARPLSPK